MFATFCSALVHFSAALTLVDIICECRCFQYSQKWFLGKYWCNPIPIVRYSIFLISSDTWSVILRCLGLQKKLNSLLALMLYLVFLVFGNVFSHKRHCCSLNMQEIKMSNFHMIRKKFSSSVFPFQFYLLALTGFNWMKTKIHQKHAVWC